MDRMDRTGRTGRMGRTDRTDRTDAVCQRAARSLAAKEATAARCVSILKQAPDMYDRGSPAWRCLTESDRDWFTESGKRTTRDRAVAGVLQGVQWERDWARRDCGRAKPRGARPQGRRRATRSAAFPRGCTSFFGR